MVGDLSGHVAVMSVCPVQHRGHRQSAGRQRFIRHKHLYYCKNSYYTGFLKRPVTGTWYINATDLIGLTGTAAFTISGYLVGYRKGLDILGVIIVSLLTAIGGGIIRDTVIGRLPVVFVDNTSLIMIAVTLMLAWVFNLAKRERRILTWSFFLADAIGLVAFSITGAQIGLLYELNLFGVVSLAFVTAVGGGMVRDMLVNEVTQILTEGIYGTVAVLIGLAMWALDTQGLLNAWALYAIAAAGLGLRLWAIVTKKSLPKLSRHESYKN